MLPSLALPAPYPLAHTSDTSNPSLALRVPDGSKRVVKYLADIFVISLRIKTRSLRGYKQLFLHSTKILKSCYLFPGRQTFFATASTVSLTFPPGGSPCPV